MRIEITLTTEEARILGEWASVRWTLQNAHRVATGDGDTQILLEDLDELTEPLSNVGAKIKDAIWAKWKGPMNHILDEYKLNRLTEQEAIQRLIELGWSLGKARDAVRNLIRRPSNA